MNSNVPPLPAPTRFSTCTAIGLSDPGRVRRANEDSFLIDTRRSLIAIADGMGGHAFGARASSTALERIAAKLALPRMRRDATLAGDPDATVHDDTLAAIRAVIDALDDANTVLHTLNRREHIAPHRSMGTTVTGLWRPPGAGLLIAFQIGDSRLYRYRDGALLQLSRDQTLYQQALDLGSIDHLPPRNVLLQALGPLPSIAPVVEAHACMPGDRYLLCSDGLHGEVPHHEIEAVLAQMGASNTEAAMHAGCRRLIDLALDAGGKDNVTAVIACFDDA
ncbi:PP2C family protein-serine/threonine phosphatase [Caballeronia humi]|uniref:PP2C-family Ser/Thr phosphatase n=1 Tax=Caballeronia humi TaxID=326474 RepID=A0A158I0E6_9BURK|nr:protein phosphatase 2C domain-containing protein [Caballeronia humi]SAL49927.1 PP2C-family Ser/Thr phosphatase [Caballeronia humi]